MTIHFSGTVLVIVHSKAMEGSFALRGAVSSLFQISDGAGDRAIPAGLIPAAEIREAHDGLIDLIVRPLAQHTAAAVLQVQRRADQKDVHKSRDRAAAHSREIIVFVAFAVQQVIPVSCPDADCTHILFFQGIFSLFCELFPGGIQHCRRKELSAKGAVRCKIPRRTVRLIEA